MDDFDIKAMLFLLLNLKVQIIFFSFDSARIRTIKNLMTPIYHNYVFNYIQFSVAYRDEYDFTIAIYILYRLKLCSYFITQCVFTNEFTFDIYKRSDNNIFL